MTGVVILKHKTTFNELTRAFIVMI